MDVPIKDWTFTHWWVRPVVKIWFNIYHKHVSYSGMEMIDWEKPIIFAPTHQNAFSDALCLILPGPYTNNHFIYPLIRADAFGKSSILDWMLTAFHMLPVYRPRDRVNIKIKNAEVFDDCCGILEQNRNILIHPEGNCIAKKQVRSFKKGLARIALGAEKKNDFNLGVTVVPVGINYKNITEPRQGIHVRCGSPISVVDYEKAYQKNEASAIAKLTAAVEQGVKEASVDIAKDEQYSLMEDVLEFADAAQSDSVYHTHYTAKQLAAKQKLIEQLDDIKEGRSSNISMLKRLMHELKQELSRQGLSLSNPLYVSDIRTKDRLWLHILGFIGMSPAVIYGWINNVLPWHLMHVFANSIKEKQFKSSARMVAGLLLFPIFYLLQATLLVTITDSWIATIAYFIFLPFTGLLCLNMWEQWKVWKQKYRIKRLGSKPKKELFKLVDHIKSLISN